MKNCFYSLILITLLQGCAGIEQPVASVQLVENSDEIDYNAIPKEMWDSLSSSQTGEKVVIYSKKLILGNKFFSASGKSCRELTEISSRVRVACRSSDSKQWFLVKSILSSYSDESNKIGNAL